MTIHSRSRALRAMLGVATAGLAATMAVGTAFAGPPPGVTGPVQQNCEWSPAALQVVCTPPAMEGLPVSPSPDVTGPVQDNCEWSPAALQVVCTPPAVEGVANGNVAAPPVQNQTPPPVGANGNVGANGDDDHHGHGGDDHGGSGHGGSGHG